MVLTLGERGVGGTASLSEADGGAVVRLPVMRCQDGHCRVGGASAQERRRGNAGGRAVGRHHFPKGRGVVQQAEVTLHGAHVVAHVRVHAAHGGVVAYGEQFTWRGQKLFSSNRFILALAVTVCI